MNFRITHTVCPLCSSEKISEVFPAKDYTVSKEFFTIWHCHQCTGRFTQAVPDEKSIEPFYQAEEYISHTETSAGLINSLYHRVRKITLKMKWRLIESVSPIRKGHLLDYGAGTGSFAAAMAAKGWKVTALEPDGKARETGRQKYGMEILPSSAIGEQAIQSVDIISLWHVLEHLHPLQERLADFHRILSTGGRLVIAVPNYTSYDARIYGEYWAAYDVPRHLYHFSPAALKLLMEAHNFEIVSHHPMWFDSIYVSMLSEKNRSGKNRMIPAVITGILSNLKALFIPATCSSVIYICKKKAD